MRELAVLCGISCKVHYQHLGGANKNLCLFSQTGWWEAAVSGANKQNHGENVQVPQHIYTHFHLYYLSVPLWACLLCKSVAFWHPPCPSMMLPFRNVTPLKLCVIHSHSDFSGNLRSKVNTYPKFTWGWHPVTSCSLPWKVQAQCTVWKWPPKGSALANKARSQEDMTLWEC